MPQDSNNTIDEWDTEVDDELQPVTDPFVVDSLGFDPLEFASDDEAAESDTESYSRPRMRTREEYARKDHHCGADAAPSGCPRDDGGKFSSKEGGQKGKQKMFSGVPYLLET